MSDSPRYLIAKYASDLQRMEPRNIGVVVFTNEGMSARFLGEKPEQPGEVDGRRVPAFVTSASTYKQWIQYWRSEINSAAAESYPPEVIDRLRETRIGHFWLSEEGVVLDTPRKGRLDALSNELFSRLVEPETPEDSNDVALDVIVNNVIRQLRLHQDKNFYTRFQVPCQVAPNVSEHFEFSHAYKNGSLKRLYQRVPLASRRSSLRRVIHDSAWMFEKVVQNGIVSRNDAVALVYATDDQQHDPEINWSFGVLSSVARVANLADQAQALSAFLLEH